MVCNGGSVARGIWGPYLYETEVKRLDILISNNYILSKPFLVTKATNATGLPTKGGNKERQTIKWR